MIDKSNKNSYFSYILFSLFVLAFVMSIPFVYSFEFDNVKSYDKETRIVTFKDSFLGIPTTKIAEAKLETPQVYQVSAGKDVKVAEFWINLSDLEYRNWITDIKFYDLNRNWKQIDRDIIIKTKSYEWKDVTKYDIKCKNYLIGDGREVKDSELLDKNNKLTSKDLVKMCDEVENGTEKKYVEIWTPITEVKLSKGLTYIGLFTDVEVNERVEWIPKIFNKEVEEWATWDSSLNNGLEYYWTFNESGSPKTDLVQGANITLEGGTLYNSTGLIGGSWQGDDTNTGSIDNLLANKDAITISFWLKTYYNPNDGSGWNFDMAHSTPANFFTQHATCAQTAIDFSNQFNDQGCENLGISDSYYERWGHFVMTAQSDGRRLLYFNGTLKANTTAGTFSNITGSFEVGGVGAGSDLNVGDFIDEFAIWNRVLSPSEISTLYANGSGITYEDLEFIDLQAIQSYPANNFVNSNISAPVNFSCNFSSSGQNITSIKFEVYNSSNSLYYSNTTSSLNTDEYNALWENVLLTQETSYLWSCYGYGSLGVNGSSNNRTFYNLQSGVWYDDFNIGLQAYWKLDEENGTIHYDSTGKYNVSGANEGNQTSDGKINWGFHPELQDSISTGINLNGQKAFTSNVWIKRNGTMADVSYMRTPLLNHNPGLMQCYTGSAGGGTLACGVADDGNNEDLDPVTIADNTWVMHTFVINNGVSITHFIDGVLQETINTDFTFTDNSISLWSNPPFNNAYLTNTIFDEWGIWNRSLTQTEMLLIYNNGNGLTYDLGISLNSTQLYPEDNYNTSESVDFSCNFSSIGQEISSVKIEVYNSSDYLSYNNTIEGLDVKSYNTTWNGIILSPDIYTWSCHGFGSLGINDSSNNRTLNITLPLVPLVQFEDPSPFNNTIYRSTNLTLNVSGINVNNITIRLYNSSGLYSENNSNDNLYSIDYESLPEGIYYINASGCNTLLCNDTETREFIVTDYQDSLIDVLQIVPSNLYTNKDSLFFNLNIRYSNLTEFYLLNSSEDLINQTSYPGLAFNNSYSINWTLPEDGTYYYYATAFGSNNSTELYNITLDTISPYFYNMSPANDTNFYTEIFYNVNLSIGIYDLGLSNATIRLYDENSSIINSTYFNLSLNNLTISDVYSLPLGEYYWDVISYDLAGNYNQSDYIRFDIYLSDAPYNLTFVPPTADNLANVSQNYIYINTTYVGIPSNFTYYLYNSLNALIDQQTVVESYYNFSSLSDGTYHYNFSMTNELNRVNYSDTRTITLDTTYPTIIYDTGSDSEGYLNKSSINYNITASDTNLVSIIIRAYNSTHSLMSSSQVNTTSSTQSLAGSFSLTDGTYYVNATACDVLDQCNSTLTRNYTLDTINPVIYYSQPSLAAGGLYDTSAIWFNATAYDVNLVNITLILQGNGGSTQTHIVTSTNTSYYYNFTGLSEGWFNYTAYATDIVNRKTWLSNRTVEIDPTSPSANYVSPTPEDGDGVITNYIPINVTATDNHLTNITLFLYYSNDTLLSSVTQATSPFYYEFNVADGSYKFKATATDSLNHITTLPTRSITKEFGGENITLCRTIRTPGTKNLGNNISSSIIPVGGACLNIISNDVVLDCKGFSIDLSTQANTINATQVSGVIIKNCILEGGSDWYGLAAYQSSVIFQNTTITDSSGALSSKGSTITVDDLNIESSTYGLVVEDGSRIIANNVTMTNVSTGIYIDKSNRSIFSDITYNSFIETAEDLIYISNSHFNVFDNLEAITAFDLSNNGMIRYFTSSNNNVSGSTFTTTESTLIDLNTNSINNYFYNTNYGTGLESVDSTSQLIRTWLYTAIVKDKVGGLIEGAIVRITGANGINDSVITNSNGISQTEVISYIIVDDVSTSQNPQALSAQFRDSTDSESATINAIYVSEFYLDQEITSTLLTRTVARIIMVMLLLIAMAASTGFFIYKMRYGDSITDVWKYFMIMLIWNTLFLILYIVLGGALMDYWYPEITSG